MLGREGFTLRGFEVQLWARDQLVRDCMMSEGTPRPRSVVGSGRRRHSGGSAAAANRRRILRRILFPFLAL